jgi:hypothetical protein
MALAFAIGTAFQAVYAPVINTMLPLVHKLSQFNPQSLGKYISIISFDLLFTKRL